MAELSSGTVLGGRFEIAGVLGEGGMATVYLATDRVRGEQVALKVLHAHLARQASMRARLRREVQAAARIRHPAALVPSELFDLDGRLCLSMPVHTGQTLADRVSAGERLSPDALRALAIQLADVVATAHMQGIVHRDITPSNVMLDRAGSAALMDFGLARIDEQRSRSTTGVVGTPGYVAPELYGGSRADARSDVYALGAVLYLAATGRSAFASPTPLGALQLQLEEGYTPLVELREDLDPGLRSTIEACLAKDPDARPQSASEVRAAFETGKPPRIPEVTPSAVTAPARPHLPSGRYAVHCRERRDDAERRKKLRQPQAADPLSRTLQEALQQGLTWGRSMLGLGEALTPEQQLAVAVATESGLPAEALQVNPVLYERHFALVAEVDQATAMRLVHRAKEAGFRAEAVEGPPGRRPFEALWHALQHPDSVPQELGTQFRRTAVIWTIFACCLLWAQVVQVWAMMVFVIATLIVTVFMTRRLGTALAAKSTRTGTDTPVAYGPDLRPWLAQGYQDALPAPGSVRQAPPQAAPAAAPPAPVSRGEALAARTAAQLDALDAALREEDLPRVMKRDLSRTSGRLRGQAEALGRQVQRLEAALAGADEPELSATVVRIEQRLERLRTLEAAGTPVDSSEFDSLSRALEQHHHTLETVEGDEVRLTRVLAHLLEIGASAAKARRVLLDAEDPTRTGTDLLAQLEREASTAAEALDEVQRGDTRQGRRQRS